MRSGGSLTFNGAATGPAVPPAFFLPHKLQLPAGAARGGAGPARGARARRRRGRLSEAGCDWLRAAAGRGTRSDGRSGANGGEMVPGPVPRAAIIPARRKRRRRRRRRGP